MKTLAEALVNERKKKNISLEQIGQKTNIKLKSLQALENGQFDQLPGSFYLKNYVKSYLHAIECDEVAFFQQYGSTLDGIALGLGEQSEVYYPKLKYSRFKQHSFLYSILIFLVVFGLAVVVFFLYGGKEKLFNTLDRFTSTGVSEPERPVLTDLWHMPANSTSFSLDYAPVRVEMRFSKNCWTQVTRGSEKLLEKVYQPGETAIFNGYSYQILLGNPGALQFFLNGQEIGYLKTLNRSEKMEINPSTVAEIQKR